MIKPLRLALALAALLCLPAAARASDCVYVGSGTQCFPTVMNVEVVATSTPSSVASATTSTQLLAANPLRRRYAVYNDSTAVLYLLENGGTASATNYTTQVPAGGFYATTNWAGPVKGAWATANGNARVTEYTP